jgi:hypothetical protein
MNAGRDVERLIADWLVEEAVAPAPDRVLDSARWAVMQTRQRRFGVALGDVMSLTIVRAAAVAAVLVLAIGGALWALGPALSGPGGPTPAPSPTFAATSGPLSTELRSLPPVGPMEPGTYHVGAPLGIDVTATFPAAGWRIWGDTVTEQVLPLIHNTPDPPDVGIIIVRVETVYADACDPAAGMVDPPLGDTVDDLVEALVAQAETVSTTPTDVEISGFSGKHLVYSFPSDENCSSLVRWPSDQGPRLAIPLERDEVWILDVDGTRWVIDLFSWPSSTAEDIAEARQIVEGLVIEPR